MNTETAGILVIRLTAIIIIAVSLSNASGYLLIHMPRGMNGFFIFAGLKILPWLFPLLGAVGMWFMPVDILRWVACIEVRELTAIKGIHQIEKVAIVCLGLYLLFEAVSRFFFQRALARYFDSIDQELGNILVGPLLRNPLTGLDSHGDSIVAVVQCVMAMFFILGSGWIMRKVRWARAR